MFSIILILTSIYGASTFHETVTNKTRENLSLVMFGEKTHNCLSKAFVFDEFADGHTPELVKYQNILDTYNIIFLFVYLGILYLGSALVVRYFNSTVGRVERSETRH